MTVPPRAVGASGTEGELGERRVLLDVVEVRLHDNSHSFGCLLQFKFVTTIATAQKGGLDFEASHRF